MKRLNNRLFYRTGYTWCIVFVISAKGDNFCDFLFAFLKIKPIMEMGSVALPERNHFYAHSGIILKTMPRFASEIGATLKGKNLLPEGANSFL